MHINEEDSKRLKVMMIKNGYTSYETDYFNSNSYRSLRKTMLENLPQSNYGLNIPFCTKSEVINAGRYVIDKHFGNLDLRVKFADGDDMESQLYAIFGPNPTPDKYEDIIRYINNQIKLLRVTDIPVYLNCSHKANGYVSSTYFYEINDIEEEYYKNHKYIKFYTMNEKKEYEIIAVFKTVAYTGFKYYQYSNFNNEREFETFVNKCRELSFYHIEKNINYGEKLITLSTCEYSQENGRLVVIAKEIL